MQAFFTDLVSNWVNWIIAGFVVWRVAKGVKDNKVGEIIWGFVLGGVAYFIANHPLETLQKASDIVAKIFGG